MRWTTTGCVVVLAEIVAVISYKHMFVLVHRYGETSWMAALLPVSVDGMIVASSMSLLADSRAGRRSSLLPWTLLVVGSAASLAANVAVAEPSVVGRVIAAWPSSALIGAYELLMRQVRQSSRNEAAAATGLSYDSDRAHTRVIQGTYGWRPPVERPRPGSDRRRRSHPRGGRGRTGCRGLVRQRQVMTCCPVQGDDRGVMADVALGWSAGFEVYAGRFAGRFPRVEARRRMVSSVRGLLSETERKNGWTPAEVAGDAGPEGMQRLLNF